MNPRERVLALVLLGVVILVGGGFLVLNFLVEPLRETASSITLLESDIAKKRLEIAQILAERSRLERWRQMSLPADVDLAQREYEKYLNDLLRQSQFAPAHSRVIPPRQIDTRSSGTLPGRKEPIYVKLVYAVETHGELSSLVAFLERFYRTGLLHQIKRLSIQRPLSQGPNQLPNGLDIRLSIEALVLPVAENRPYLPPVDQRFLILEAVAGLRRGSGGLASALAVAGPAGPHGAQRLAQPARQYAAINGKNIFYGPPPPPPPPPPPEKPPPVVTAPVDKTDVTPFVLLTDITISDARTEAFLFDQYNNRRIRLQNSAGFDAFRIRDAQGNTVVAGKVVAIQSRDLVFLVEDQLYAWHIGQNLKEALARPLNDKQLLELGLIRE